MKEKIINGYPFQLYKRDNYDTPQMIKKSSDFLLFMDKRRSVRDFSGKQVPREVIENIILTASTSPSDAHKQPWTFCAVSDPKLKSAIRKTIETNEQEIKGSELKDLKHDLRALQTQGSKEFIETAPWIIVVFKKVNDDEAYNAEESVGIATGMLLTAIHNAGLAALTYCSPSLVFLKEKLGRPANEQLFAVIPMGHPAENCYVPKLIRKGLKDIAVFYEE